MMDGGGEFFDCLGVVVGVVWVVDLDEFGVLWLFGGVICGYWGGVDDLSVDFICWVCYMWMYDDVVGFEIEQCWQQCDEFF